MNEIERELKKYKLDVLLTLLANLSKELFSNKVAFKVLEWKRPIGGFLQTFKQILSAWNLADLSFMAIRSSNDYRSIDATNDTVFRLNNLLHYCPVKIEHPEGALLL